MTRRTLIKYIVQLLMVCVVNGQVCPANTAMGLCHPVEKPCLTEADCFNGEICCPEACSRSCKSRSRGPVSADSSAPDLLNDPRVYVGKCPDASCYNLFGGEPNECSTSRLCPEGHYCCNDGCKNVCTMKPEFAAMVARQEARAKKHQQLIIQRQQEEMRRRQQEMNIQRQRQLATAERARKQAEARAAAEAELAAQQTRAKYEANLKAVAVAQSKSVSALQQRMAQLQGRQQNPQHQPPSAPVTISFLDNFVGEPPSVNNIASSNNNPNQQSKLLQATTALPAGNEINRYFTASKRNNIAGILINQINSPANPNPYNLMSQQSVSTKDKQSELLSLIQPGIRSEPVFSAPQLTKVNPPQQPPLRNSPKVSNAYGTQALTSVYASKSSQQLYPTQYYYRNPAVTDRRYQSAGQFAAHTPYTHQTGQGPVDPFLMYHAVQTAI